jgi:hypothetical protein
MWAILRCSTLNLLAGVFAFSFISFILVLYLDLLPEHEVEGEEKWKPEREIADQSEAYDFRKKVHLPLEPPTDLPVIVWWTPLTPYQRRENVCPEGTCLVTQSRNELTNPALNVSAFIFYGTQIDLNDLPLPRRPDHLWALLHEESPKNNWILATEKGISLFNITSTVSRYSHYPLHLHAFHTVEILLQPIHTPTHLKSKGGLGLVIFLQSTCNPPSDRDSYVRELMKYISVDCYGKCLHNRDLPEHLINPLTFGEDEVLDIVGKYKFTLSFENAICHDYLTEKFWRPLYAGSVPVVRGSPTIRDWDPSSGHPSIIIADDFDDPHALAKYLLELDKNDAEYERFLDFKRTGVTNKRLLSNLQQREWVVDGKGEGGNFIDGFECFVCDTLHKRKKQETDPRVRKKPLMVADSSHYHCLPPTPSVMRKGQSVRESLNEMVTDSRGELEHWIRNARCSEARGGVAWTAIAKRLDQQGLDSVIDGACNDIWQEELR